MITAPLDPGIRREDLPPIPSITSEHITVFPGRPSVPSSLFLCVKRLSNLEFCSPDNETLEHLGDSIVGLCVTALIREMYPYLRVGPATKIRAIVVGNSTLAAISTFYRLQESLRLHPAQAITLRASTNIQADVFESYVAGIYVTQGLEVVQQWLSLLFRPYVALAYRIIRAEYGLPLDSLPPLPEAKERSSPLSTVRYQSPPRNYSVAPAGVTTGHLSLFNQYLQQKGKFVKWVWTESDVSNGKATPVWAVRAMIERECVGKGRATTKKAAKNEAAAQALEFYGVCV